MMTAASNDPTASSPSKTRRNNISKLPLKRSNSKGKDGARREKLLYLLVGLAFGIAITNLFIGHRTINPSYDDQNQHYNDHDQSPVEQRKTRGTNSIVPTNDNNQGDGELYDGEHITQILRGNKPYPSNINRLRYKPGTLDISHAEAVQHCYINTTHYAGHIADRPQSLVSLSHTYKLIYRNIPKSSSSSARHAMQDFLEGDDNRMKHDKMEELVHEKNYNMVSFVREPMNRFYSSYDEAFFRLGPWMGSGPIVRDKPRVRKAYFEIKWKVDKYPYLYEGLENIHDFRLMYCPVEILNTGKFLDCNLIPSIDDGNLAHRFEQFVRDYSGLDPFDIQKVRVSAVLACEPFPVTAIYNSTEAEKGWQEIASSKGVTIPDGEMTHGRKITRRFNVTKVSDDAKRKICRILALDYCCLNIELPDICRGDDGDEDGDAVYCAMQKRNEKTMKYALQKFVLYPWKDP